MNKSYEPTFTTHKFIKAADVKLRQLKATGELHYKICETMENSDNDIKEINSNLKTIQTLAGKLKSFYLIQQQISVN